MADDGFDRDVEVFGRNWMPPDDYRSMKDRLAEHPILVGLVCVIVSAAIGAYCGWRFL